MKFHRDPISVQSRRGLCWPTTHFTLSLVYTKKGQACPAAPKHSCDPTHREVRHITDLTTKLTLQIRQSKMCGVTSRELSHFFKQQHSFIR